MDLSALYIRASHCNLRKPSLTVQASPGNHPREPVELKGIV